MKRPNLRLIGIEGVESQLKGQENIFSKIIEERFPNLKKNMPTKVQEAYRTQIDWRRKKILLPHNSQNTKHTEQRRVLKAAKKKGQVIYKGKPIGITPDFSIEILKVRRTWIDVLKTKTTDANSDYYIQQTCNHHR